ncbi:MAG TPA: hypothetical protein VMY78_07705 [Solirubrobacteraceae bacterium]|nr:hypothetical protein [Solirubrobacteraceae bacterium]
MRLDGRRPSADLLTRAEAAALRRSAPLTHAVLAEHLKTFTQATPGP